MKNVNRLIVILLTIAVCLNSSIVFVFSDRGSDSLPIASENNTDLVVVPSNALSKIHFYVGGEKEHTTINSIESLYAATDSAKQHIESFKSTGTRSTGNADFAMTIQLTSNIYETEGYVEFVRERENLDSIEKVRDFRRRLVDYSKNYHNEIVAASSELLSTLDCEEIQTVDLSPFVVATIASDSLTATELLRLANEDAVSHISISILEEESYSEVEFDDNITMNNDVETFIDSTTTISEQQNMWDDVLRNLGAYDYVTNATYTGEGIRIGILENGRVDFSAEALDGLHMEASDVSVVYDEAENEVSNHATAVLYTAWQIAPDACYYSSGRCDSPFSGLTWMIDNEIDIVNYSAGYACAEPADYGYKMNTDAVIDYLVGTYFVIFVKSAGNYSEDHMVNNNLQQGTYGHITSPGYAHNVITVGGVTAYSDGSDTYIDHDVKSCYLDDSTDSIKPNICAFYDYTFISTHNTVKRMSGTSISAPQVVGCIALLLERNTEMIIFPEAVRALIQATASKTHTYETNPDQEKWYDDKVGAGIINLTAMMNQAYTVYNIYNMDTNSVNYVVYSTNIYMFESVTFRASIAWFNHCTMNDNGEISQVLMTDYDIVICNVETGEEIVGTYSSGTTDEIIEFIAPEAGMYRLEIYQYGQMASNAYSEHCCLAYKPIN